MSVCPRSGQAQPNVKLPSFALFEIPCPSSAVECGLWVSTDNSETTVGFHTHHSHFGGFWLPFDQERMAEDEKSIEAALDEAEDILNERLIVVSRYRGNKFVSSGMSRVGDDIEPVGLLPKWLVRRSTLRSWNCTYDREVEHQAPWLGRLLFGP